MSLRNEPSATINKPLLTEALRPSLTPPLSANPNCFPQKEMVTRQQAGTALEGNYEHQ